MPKSKQRKGHKKKVQVRTAALKSEQLKFQKEMMEKMEELRQKFQEQSGTTQNPETNEMGLIQPKAGI
jgi:hypothetical protein